MAVVKGDAQSVFTGGWFITDGGGGGSAPAEPTISVAWLSSTSMRVTFTDAAGYTARVLYSTVADGGATWTEGGSRSGNGDVDVTGLTAGTIYYVTAQTEDSGYFSRPANVEIIGIGTDNGAVGAYASFLSELFDAIKASTALAGAVSDAPAGHVKLGWQLWSDSSKEAAIITNGPIVYIRPDAYTKLPGDNSDNRCDFACRLTIHEQLDQSASSLMMTPLNFVDALTNELATDEDGSGTRWSSNGFGLRFDIDGPHNFEDKLDRVATDVRVRIGWSEDI